MVLGSDIAEQQYGPDESDGAVLVHTRSGRGFELEGGWQGQVTIARCCLKGICGPIGAAKLNSLLREIVKIPGRGTLLFDLTGGEGVSPEACPHLVVVDGAEEPAPRISRSGRFRGTPRP